MVVCNWLEKYGLLLILLFCLSIFSPDLDNKVNLMDQELDAVTDSHAGSNAFKQMFWIVLFLFFSFRFLVSAELTKYKPIIFNKLAIIMLVCIVAILSASWSNYPMIALKRSIFQVLFCVTVSLAFCFSFYHKTIEDNLKLAAVICILMVLISILVGAGFNNEFKLAGYVRSKNTMGINLVVLIVISFMWIKAFQISSKFLIMLLVILFVLLLMTQSKTSIILCLAYFLLVNLNLFKVKVITSILGTILFCVFIFIPGISFHINDYQHIALYVDADFITGRGVIWDALYYDLGFFDKITLGYGYGSYFEVGVIPFVLDNKHSFLQYISSAHNGYLQLLLQFGVVGSAFIFIFIFASMLKIDNLYINAALIIPILQNITESSIFRDANMAWFLTIMIIISSAIHRIKTGLAEDQYEVIDS